MTSGHLALLASCANAAGESDDSQRAASVCSSLRVDFASEGAASRSVGHGAHPEDVAGSAGDAGGMGRGALQFAELARRVSSDMFATRRLGSTGGCIRLRCANVNIADKNSKKKL